MHTVGHLDIDNIKFAQLEEALQRLEIWSTMKQIPFIYQFLRS